MLARGATYNLPLHSPTEPSSGGGSGGKENLINALVRRYLLLAQVPASEWSRNEAALCMLGESLLSRYDYHLVFLTFLVAPWLLRRILLMRRA